MGIEFTMQISHDTQVTKDLVHGYQTSMETNLAKGPGH